jgi:hypothetical protein
MGSATTEKIFQELAGERAARLNPAHFPAAVQERIASAMIATGLITDPQRARDIGFHLTDWNGDAAFLVALLLYPEKFTDEEVAAGIDKLLIHLPAHVMEAARLKGYPPENIFDPAAPGKPSP